MITNRNKHHQQLQLAKKVQFTHIHWYITIMNKLTVTQLFTNNTILLHYE